MRLNRFLASAGLGSRRGVEELIQSGGVRINGRVVTDLATQVEPTDAVKVGSRLIRSEKLIHAILHKPKGYVCTADDERDRRTIFDLLPSNWPRVFHVGRLDKESEGLLIVTNDGDLSLHLTHPRFKIDKEYEVGLDKPFEPLHREKLLRGMHIFGGWAKAEHVTQIGAKALRVILRQGLKRQIRLMFSDLGYEVTHLRRIRIGPIALGNLNSGEWRLLSAKEVDLLKKVPAPEPVAKDASSKGGRSSNAPRPSSIPWTSRPSRAPKAPRASAETEPVSIRLPKPARATDKVAAPSSRFPKTAPRASNAPRAARGPRTPKPVARRTPRAR